ncbi:hypothetical protein [Rhodococcus sp. 1139]|uniref:hypothetical protein n=1 Tax=Rhodococcus sp. 1139 TaxID=1833762 RepID=UPI00087242F9|nr:hypothetical protein [Rhodococcus sp. 1139]OFE06466.1 hypothetical protein A5N83_23090 [Rhodococcus sp. 1139]
MNVTSPVESADGDQIGVFVADGHAGDLLDSVLARTVAFVEVLEQEAATCGSAASAEAAHIRHLSESVSGIVLDFVREWPS